jgi:hypothetical protein
MSFKWAFAYRFSPVLTRFFPPSNAGAALTVSEVRLLGALPRG